MRFEYVFTFEGGREERFEVVVDDTSLDITAPLPENLPEWTALDFEQCPHCPLGIAEYPQCPLAARILPLVERLKDLVSFTEADVSVLTEAREIRAHTTLQRGLSSLMGLIIPASGCPHTTFFRPMAKFHLPFSTEDETAYRAISMYLLAQHFREEEGDVRDVALKGLRKIYENIGTVNMHVAKRLRAVEGQDSSVNAIILLDIFSQVVPVIIDECLEQVSLLFKPYLDDGQQ
ncbi:MAG: hypothetical protein KKC99_02460 [Proteobacteria bacterium]|nr:hypothetical protein [Pseudomonadota bacterium]